MPRAGAVYALAGALVRTPNEEYDVFALCAARTRSRLETCACSPERAAQKPCTAENKVRAWPPNNACSETLTDPLMPHRPVILFDGDCNFCNATVRWIVKRDKRKTLRFARLQSPAARRIVAFADPEIDFEALPDSMAFVEEDVVYTSSSAALRVARYLRFPWPVLVVALAIPRFLRDSVYRFIARNRYRWFGASAACPTPPPDFASRLFETEGDLDQNRFA